MKYRSPAPKPETGMEMTVTLSMAADQSAEQSAEALVKFLGGVNHLVAEVGACWVKINCAGIPVEFEERLEAALASLGPKKPQLQLVVNNRAFQQKP